ATTEEVAVTTLEAHHRPAGAGVLEEQLVDAFLRGEGTAGDLADVDDLGPGRVLVDGRERHEPGGDDGVGRGEGVPGREGQQSGVAGSGPDEEDPAGGVRGGHALRGSSWRIRASARSSPSMVWGSAAAMRTQSAPRPGKVSP